MALNANIPLSVETPKLDSPLATIGGLMQLKGQITENALRQSQIQKENQQTADLKQANDLALRNQGDATTFQKALASNNGNWGATFDQLAKQGSLLPANLSKFQKDHFDAVEAASKSDAQTLTTNNAKLAAVGSAVAGIQQLEASARPQAWVATKQRLASDPQLADIAQHLPDTWDDKAAEQLAWGGTAAKDINDAALKLQEQRNKDQKALDDHLESLAKQPGLQAESQLKTTLTADTLANPQHLSPVEAAQEADRKIQQELAQKKFDQDLTDFTEKVRHNKADENETARYHNMSMEGVSLTPEAKTKMAEMFAQTGVLPNLGMGKAAGAMRSEILNMAAKNFPNVDFASSKAAFQANSSSLRNLQGLSDRVDAFENTAGKNIDIFLKAAKDVVDTGNPMLNKPVRAIADAFGSEKMAAFKAARETALTESAKVLESPTGGSSLSMSGRNAVKTLSDENATLGQQVAAMKVLRQDMANRKQANQEEIKAIKDRIGGGTSSTSSASTHKEGAVVTVGGKKVKITKMYGDGTFDGDEVK